VVSRSDHFRLVSIPFVASPYREYVAGTIVDNGAELYGLLHANHAKLSDGRVVLNITGSGTGKIAATLIDRSALLAPIPQYDPKEVRPTQDYSL
jgi:hypothetical protein